MNQSSFADTIQLIKIQPQSDLNRSVSSEEKRVLRAVVGHLNWSCGISRPDLRSMYASLVSKYPKLQCEILSMQTKL